MSCCTTQQLIFLKTLLFKADFVDQKPIVN
jgi:hypothetical protein